jgi:Transposase DDE domain
VRHCPVKGRALTLYEEAHPHAKLGNRKAQHAFLDVLKTLLPATSRPIIIADSGFRVPFYRYVDHALGWHWLGRYRRQPYRPTTPHQLAAGRRLVRLPALVHRGGREKPTDCQTGARQLVQ